MTDRIRLAAQALLDVSGLDGNGDCRCCGRSLLNWGMNPIPGAKHKEDCASEALRRALAEHAEEPNTNEFWADGMRVGKTVGFKNGVEAAAEYLSQWAGYMISLNTIANVRALIAKESE